MIEALKKLAAAGAALLLLASSSGAQQKPPAESERPAADAATKTPKKQAPRTPVAEMQAFIATQAIDKSKSDWKTKLPRPPQLKFADGKTYTWQLKTNKGEMKIRLMPDVAPMHVSSTIYLTELGFYDGTGFHRVITGFMAQGGDPLGNGRGGPGYSYDGEFDKAVKHDRPGLLSMANAGPGTDGSQFFLTFVATPHLDGKHTIFGAVVDGMDTVKALEARGSGSGKTSEPLVIVKATCSVA